MKRAIRSSAMKIQTLNGVVGKQANPVRLSGPRGEDVGEHDKKSAGEARSPTTEVAPSPLNPLPL